jgi:hypothetical protein
MTAALERATAGIGSRHALKTLHEKNVPQVAPVSRRLAIVDAVRGGRARERELAAKELRSGLE